MRILISTPYDLAVPGGVNRHAFDLFDVLATRGHDVKLLGPASAPVRMDDPRVMRLGKIWSRPFNGAETRITLQLRVALPIRRLMREFRPEIVHVQEPFVPLLNPLVLWFAGRARCIGTFHTFSETSRGYFWSWPWCRAVWRRLDARVAVSPAAREFVARYHPGEYTVIPNGIRLPAPELVRPAGPVHHPVRLLMVGRTGEPRKGFSVLREALGRLERESPGRFSLEVVGPDRPDVAGLPIQWRGHLSDAELGRVYATTDIAIVPSTGRESFGLVALEALAHGVPVIASRIRGYAEWLDGAEVGALFAPGDAAELATAIRDLAQDPSNYATCAQRTGAHAARFSWENNVERLLDLYEPGRSKELGVGQS